VAPGESGNPCGGSSSSQQHADRQQEKRFAQNAIAYHMGFYQAEGQQGAERAAKQNQTEPCQRFFMAVADAAG